MIETKSQSLHLVNPWRTEHIRRATRGKSGEIQEIWDNGVERAVLMVEGRVSQPKILSVSPDHANHAGNITYTIAGKNLIPYGWRQARLTIDPTGNNNGLEWYAVQPGVDGNDIAIEYVDNGGATAVGYNGTTKVVTVGMNIGGGGDTAANVLSALAASATGAQYVVQARHVFGSSGAGNITVAVAQTHLAGGLGRALRRATTTIGAAASSHITWTARKPGVDGNLIAVAYVNGLGANLLPVATVLGTHISFLIRAASTTANDIIRVAAGDENVRRLVESHLLYADNGTGLPGAVSSTHLTGGSDGTGVKIYVAGLAGAISDITDTAITANIAAVSLSAAGDLVQAEIDICGYEHNPWLSVI